MDRVAVKPRLEGAAHPQTSHLWLYVLRSREALGHNSQGDTPSKDPPQAAPHSLPPSPNSEAQDLVPCGQAAQKAQKPAPRTEEEAGPRSEDQAALCN